MMTIKRLEDVTEYPLCWPDTKPRCAKRRKQDYGWNDHLSHAMDKLGDEMRRINVRIFVVSMSPKHRFGSPDPGAAVWWNAKAPDGKFELRVLACDVFEKADSNLYAIALTLDRMRALERYGAYTADQAMQGARALALPPPPEHMGAKSWRDVLGVSDAMAEEDQLILANGHYRRMAADAAEIPDSEQKNARLLQLNAAIDMARQEVGPK